MWKKKIHLELEFHHFLFKSAFVFFFFFPCSFSGSQTLKCKRRHPLSPRIQAVTPTNSSIRTESKLWIYSNPRSPSIQKQTQKPKSSPKRLRRIITKFIPISSYTSTPTSITAAMSDPNSAVVASTAKRQ